MKAVIVGIKGRYAAALTGDGRIVRIRNCGYTVGQTVDPKALTSAPPLKKAVTWVAAAAAALALCIGGGSLYAAPYAFVSLDVNPSVEYVLNRFDRVLSVTAVNDDGAAILEDVRLTNKSIDDAVRMTLNRIADEGYFGEAKTNGLLIATSCGNEKASEQLALRLEKKAQEETGSLNAEVQVAAVTVSQEKVEEAKFLGVTPGKLDLVEQLKASAEDPDSIDTAVWLSQPVGEIMNEIKATQDCLTIWKRTRLRPNPRPAPPPLKHLPHRKKTGKVLLPPWIPSIRCFPGRRASPPFRMNLPGAHRKVPSRWSMWRIPLANKRKKKKTMTNGRRALAAR